MKPFESIRVLDLTHVLAGPFCTAQLAALGADVIKIESPGNPDMTRIEGVDAEQNAQYYGSYFQAQNAGKRAITLDLTTSLGQDAMWRLIKTADVLVQNFAGNALDRLGFDYDSVIEQNPQLIYCSITGFGRTGPKADHPAYDVVIQAYSGLMKANGEKGSDPVRVGPPMVDYGTGAQAALAISAALYQRMHTQKGQRIDVAMLDAALMMMSSPVCDTQLTAKSPEPHGNNHPRYAGYATYPTCDGLLMIGAWTNKQLAALMEVLGETDRAGEILTMPRSETGDTRDTDARLIEAHLSARSAEEWECILNKAHVPAARVRSLDETLAEEQITSRSVLQSVSNQQSGSPARYPVAAFSYAHGTPSFERPPPRLGEHTAEILTELGYTDNEVSRFSSPVKT